ARYSPLMEPVSSADSFRHVIRDGIPKARFADTADCLADPLGLILQGIRDIIIDLIYINIIPRGFERRISDYLGPALRVVSPLVGEIGLCWLTVTQVDTSSKRLILVTLTGSSTSIRRM